MSGAADDEERTQPREGAICVLTDHTVTPGSTGGLWPRPTLQGSATVGPGVFLF